MNSAPEQPYLAVGLPGSPESSRPKPASQRKKLWELDGYYHCSVIGTCLTLAELRQIQRRLGGVAQALNSDYDLHRVFVSAARESVPASRLVHKFLDRKYKPAIQQLCKARTEEEFNAYWNAALASGDIAGAYWALITQPGIPSAVLDRVYGEVHMLSHLSGASVRVDLQELNRLRRRCPELEMQLADAKATARRRLAEQQDIIGALNKRLLQSLKTERKLQAAEARLARVEGQPLVEELTARLAAERARAERAETATETWQQQANRSIDQNQWLTHQLDESLQERDLLESTLERLLAQSGADFTEADATTDANPDLFGRCVLYVGGRHGQCKHFRELVERRNGRFIHHDGGREDARAQLWDVVRQADAVFCPLDCVSHDAVHRIKRFCERHTKPLVLLPRASLAAFNRGLNAVSS
ncbi:MAG: DUF2325 domain-containing protein [Gammaproteobacteria bacterium]